VADIARVLQVLRSWHYGAWFSSTARARLAHWAKITVINGLSDFSTPVRLLADALTIYETFGKLKGVNVTYVGDGNNVAVSLMQISAKMGANFSIANPENFDMPAAQQLKPPWKSARGSDPA
jgi:ornithine carbamoyltransferase